jgi:hypothetical protein
MVACGTLEESLKGLIIIEGRPLELKGVISSVYSPGV